MLPCEYVEVSLVYIGSSKDPIFDQPSNLVPMPTSELATSQYRATVLHLPNYCDENYVDVTLVRDLFRTHNSTDTAMPDINNDTRVILRWHYTPLDETEVTTHRVIRDSRYQMILRKQDWERPIQRWLQLEAYQRRQRQQQKQQHQHQQIQQDVSAETTSQQKADASSRQTRGKLDVVYLASSTNFVPPSPALSEWDDDEDSEMDCEWSEVEIIEPASSKETLSQDDSKSFWRWSKDHHNWFHQNEDHTLTWFDELD